MTGAILLQIVLIALNAVFASAEIAVISMNDAKLERLAQKGNKQAKRLVALTAQPARFLATIQVAITLSGFLGSIRLSDIEDAIGVTFTEECDTFTRFVFQKFGMVPKDGDTKIELEIENMHIIIDKIKIIQYYIGGLYIVGLYRHKIH